MIRRHRPDEEPDVDERDPYLDWEAEQTYGAGLCERCGIEGHEGRKCPTITPVLLR